MLKVTVSDVYRKARKEHINNEGSTEVPRKCHRYLPVAKVVSACGKSSPMLKKCDDVDQC